MMDLYDDIPQRSWSEPPPGKITVFPKGSYFDSTRSPYSLQSLFILGAHRTAPKKSSWEGLTARTDRVFLKLLQELDEMLRVATDQEVIMGPR